MSPIYGNHVQDGRLKRKVLSSLCVSCCFTKITNRLRCMYARVDGTEYLHMKEYELHFES